MPCFLIILIALKKNSAVILIFVPIFIIGLSTLAAFKVFISVLEQSEFYLSSCSFLYCSQSDFDEFLECVHLWFSSNLGLFSKFFCKIAFLILHSSFKDFN